MVTRRADSTPKSVTSSVWSLSAFIVTLRVDQMITKISFILKSCLLIAHPLHFKTGMAVGGREDPFSSAIDMLFFKENRESC